MIIIAICTSCVDSDKQQALNLVKEWSGKEIKFPTQMDFINSSGQSVDFDFSTANHKVLVYVDSLGCTSCKLKLGQWKNLIDSLDKFQVPVLFIFQSKDPKSIKHVMLESAFDYPYFQDIDGTLNSLNVFSEDSRFQTFLLDSKNQIKLIWGINPVETKSNLIVSYWCGNDSYVGIYDKAAQTASSYQFANSSEYQLLSNAHHSHNDELVAVVGLNVLDNATILSNYHDSRLDDGFFVVRLKTLHNR